MSRLTGWDKGHAYMLECFKCDGCEDRGTSKCDFCEHNLAIFEKLAAYEDLGEPENLVGPIRCRDCKWRDSVSGRCRHSVMDRGENMVFVKPDDYCSCGELRGRSAEE